MNVIEPFNFEEANGHAKWRNLMKEEYDSLMRNDMGIDIIA